MTVEINKVLLKHRDKIGSTKFEEITLAKLIFHYLTFASMCYRAGIPIASILLCRTALEAGLRERVAEELARKETNNKDELAKKTWELIKQLKDNTLDPLISKAEDENIIGKQEIENVFKNLKLGNQSSRKVLDKFIHGDITWIFNFVKNRENDTKVIGAKNKLEESKIIADSKIDEIAAEALKATTKIAEIL
ncbi:MAG: hypothetical protein QMC85_05465, partial [Methanocellales archaeon]|nr:hypothetical protein [Methanocellales archaeon]